MISSTLSFFQTIILFAEVARANSANLGPFATRKIWQVVVILLMRKGPRNAPNARQEAIKWAENYIATLEKKYSKKIYSNF